MMLTGRLIIRTYVGRGAMLWLLTRALISAVIVAANGNPFALSPRSAIIVILVSTLSGLAQSARLREWALLANLGVSVLLLEAGPMLSMADLKEHMWPYDVTHRGAGAKGQAYTGGPTGFT